MEYLILKNPVADWLVALVVVAAVAAGLDAIVRATGLAIHDAALAAARLERDGWLVEAGGWFEPAGSRLEAT